MIFFWPRLKTAILHRGSERKEEEAEAEKNEEETEEAIFPTQLEISEHAIARKKNPSKKHFFNRFFFMATSRMKKSKRACRHDGR